jgi:hypothetical protein
MSRYLTYYYLLFFLLITGAFASMAQNAYGMTILGIAAICFSLLFAIQWLRTWNKKEKKWLPLTELTCLVLLSALLALRVFNIHFKSVEALFTGTAIVLAVVYAIRLAKYFMSEPRVAGSISWLVSFYYLSLIFFLLAASLAPLIPGAAAPSGILAFVLLLLFVAGSWISRNQIVEGEKISGFQMVGRFKDRSALLLSLFLLFTIYTGLTRLGWLPKMYTSVYPQTYYQLLNQAESGQEVPVEGRYRHEAFKEAYDRFAESHLMKK